jgi:hypothetical protein
MSTAFFRRRALQISIRVEYKRPTNVHVFSGYHLNTSSSSSSAITPTSPSCISFRAITPITLPPLPSITTTMRSLTLPAAMALAACVSATPVAAPASNDLAGLADHFSSYITGFKNPSIVPSVGGKALCVSGIVDVTASATNHEFLIQASTNRTELTELLLELFQINSTLPATIFGKPTQVSGTFGIYSQLCFPTR